MLPLLLLALAGCAVGQRPNYSYNYTEYSVQALGDSVIMDCSKDGIDTTGATPEGWILPSRTLVTDNQTMPRFQLLSGGMQLHLTDFVNDDIGFYYCVLERDAAGTYHDTADDMYLHTRPGSQAGTVRVIVKVALNVRGPYFDNPLERYKWNLVIAFSAGGGFAVICSLFCMAYKFSWSERQKNKIHSDDESEEGMFKPQFKDTARTFSVDGPVVEATNGIPMKVMSSSPPPPPNGKDQGVVNGAFQSDDVTGNVHRKRSSAQPEAVATGSS